MATQLGHTANQPWEPSIGYLRSLMSRANATGPSGYYPGQTVADVNPAMQAGLQSQLGGAANMGAALGGFNDAWSAALGGEARDMSKDPNVLSAMRMNSQSAYSNLRDNILPELNRGTLGIQGFQNDSGRRLAQGVALGRTQDAITQGNASILNAAQGREQTNAQQRWQQAFGMAPTAMNMQMAPGQAMFGLGQDARGLQQQFIDADRERFQFGQDAPWQHIARQASVINPIASMGSYGHSYGKQPDQGGGSALGTGLGLGLMALGLPGSSVGGSLIGDLF